MIRLLLAAALAFQPGILWAREAPDDPALTQTIAALDTKVFDAYNHCDLAAFGGYFSPTVEFYHDKGGATFDRATVIANTKKYICGKVHRDLLPATLHIYPIRDFGAIEEGEHRFCEIATGNCDGIAKFLIVWKRSGADWQITRVLSYGHRAMTEAEKARP
jgi:hypothetical protein